MLMPPGEPPLQVPLGGSSCLWLCSTDSAPSPIARSRTISKGSIIRLYRRDGRNPAWPAGRVYRTGSFAVGKRAGRFELPDVQQKMQGSRQGASGVVQAPQEQVWYLP